MLRRFLIIENLFSPYGFKLYNWRFRARTVVIAAMFLVVTLGLISIQQWILAIGLFLIGALFISPIQQRGMTVLSLYEYAWIFIQFFLTNKIYVYMREDVEND